MFNVSESIRLAEEEAKKEAELNGYRKREEYLVAALRKIIEAANEEAGVDRRVTVTGIAGCAILGSWTRE